MSTLQQALELARRGFHVFPVRPDSKLPAIDGYPDRATRDEATIINWWVDPVLKMERPFNIGISTSRYGENEALLVVDVDNKGDKRGEEELLKLELEGKEFPPTYTQVTPTRGQHLIYKTRVPVKQGANVLGPGLDTRGRGGYILARGSSIGGRAYVGNEAAPAPAPEWLVAQCGQAREKEAPQAPAVEGVDQKTAHDRAIHYLSNEAPLAVEGQGGDATTFAVACKVKDFGVIELDCLTHLLICWNPRCSPPWSPEELEQKVANAYRYGKDPVGAASPEADFDPVHEVTAKDEEKSYLEKMNDEYALVYMEGGHYILHETVDEKGRPHRVFLTEPTFKRRFSPFTVQQGKGKAPTYAEVWLDWKGRREYKGVCFAPEREPRHGYYNLWRGFTCTPVSPEAASAQARRGLEMFLDHARANVCQGDEKLFKWLMGYFAHMVQKPYERPLTTLVFRGKKGTGKNALVDRVGNLLGSGHYLVAHDGRYLTSNFNGHLDSCLCLVLDEAFWSGDKSAEGKLKGLTTAPEIMIERKGKEPYTVDNLVRLIVIGNEEWLVPASQDERRYAVLDVGEGRMQDREFFHQMRELVDNRGGNAVLLHYFQTFDLSAVDVNHAPSTQALMDQKVSSLEPFYQWWLECLTDGHIVGAEFPSTDWQTQVDKDALRSAFRRYTQNRNIRGWAPDANAFGRLLKKCLPGVETGQKRREGDHLINVYRLPDLKQSRAAWSAYMRQEVVWPD